MDELIKSIRIGAVDFFGMVIPGILLISICTLGFFLPILFLIVASYQIAIDWRTLYADTATPIFFVAIIFSYVLGYILRLSSPDELDEESAKAVIQRESEKNPKFLEEDGWPYDLTNKSEKYPYSKFREYLKKRGHLELLEELVTWCPDNEFREGAVWDDLKNRKGKPIAKTKRSKSAVNEMKMKVRVQCPELSALIESKRDISVSWLAHGQLSKYP